LPDFLQPAFGPEEFRRQYGKAQWNNDKRRSGQHDHRYPDQRDGTANNRHDDAFGGVKIPTFPGHARTLPVVGVFIAGQWIACIGQPVHEGVIFSERAVPGAVPIDCMSFMAHAVTRSHANGATPVW